MADRAGREPGPSRQRVLRRAAGARGRSRWVRMRRLSGGQLGSCALVPPPGSMPLPSVRPAASSIWADSPPLPLRQQRFQHAPLAVARHTAEKLRGASEMVTCEDFPAQATAGLRGAGNAGGRQPDRAPCWAAGRAQEPEGEWAPAPSPPPASEPPSSRPVPAIAQSKSSLAVLPPMVCSRERSR
jgi:hypothetical protein